uniref:NADH dehydrogenase subunit 1 n=1 Tax=Satsuma myomphala TaxID=358001 RepID=UPI00300142E3
MLLMPVVKVLITFLCVLLGVAYMTLLERKVLSYLQNRKGPNKVGLSGLFQPFADAIKLFLKELIYPYRGNNYLFFLLPIMSLAMGLFVWGVLPSTYSLSSLNNGVLIFLCISAVNVYVMMGAGWASNSAYAFLGAMRASAQTISYEVSLVFILLFPCFFTMTVSFFSMMNGLPLCVLMFYCLLCWLITCLAETNRAPFDFAEGESELVSGFNIEYGSGPFALLFLGEYATILFFSVVTAICFFGVQGILVASLVSWVIAFIFLFIRGVYPRHRYDKLMGLCWTSILPTSMGFLCLVPLMQWF